MYICRLGSIEKVTDRDQFPQTASQLSQTSPAAVDERVRETSRLNPASSPHLILILILSLSLSLSLALALTLTFKTTLSYAKGTFKLHPKSQSQTTGAAVVQWCSGDGFPIPQILSHPRAHVH